MKIDKHQAIQEDWDEVKSWNYKLTNLDPKMSVVYVELEGEHGLVQTNDLERIYYIIEGQGEFTFNNEKIFVDTGSVITIPPKTEYDYKTISEKLKAVMFMELWDN